MREEWTLPGWFEDVRVVRGRDARAAERDAAHAPGIVAHRLRSWLADDRARPLLIRLFDELTGGASYGGDGLSAGALDRMIAARLERAFREREIVLLRARNDDGLPPLAEHAQEAPAAGQPRAMGVEDDWIEIALFDSAGDPVDGAAFTVMQGKTELGAGTTGADGVGRVFSIPPRGASACAVSFQTWAKQARALPMDAPPAGPPKLDASRVRGPVDDARHVLRRELLAPQLGHMLGTNVWQLARRTATAVELEHFTDGGAVFLPGYSPAPLREGVPLVTGIDALKAAIERCRHEKHVVVTGHHAARSTERAKSVLLLLMAKREEWAALSAGNANLADRAHVRSWALADLPDAETPWTQATWARVFDLYMKELAPPTPAKLVKRPRIEVRRGKNFVPHVVARDATGDAERYVEMNPENPAKPMKGDRGWHPTWPGETVWLPFAWDQYVNNLVAAGWDAHHAELGPSAPLEPFLNHEPRLAGCRDRHVDHPWSKARGRRARARAVEILVLPGEALVCGTETTCDTTTCEAYDPYAYDLQYAEVLGVTFRVQLFDIFGQPLRDAPYEIVGAGVSQSGVSATSFVDVRASEAPERCRLRWSRPLEVRRAHATNKEAPLPSFEYEIELCVAVDAEHRRESAQRRLNNLGHDHDDLAVAVRSYQRWAGMDETGDLDHIATDLWKRHDEREPYQHHCPSPSPSPRSPSKV